MCPVPLIWIKLNAFVGDRARLRGYRSDAELIGLIYDTKIFYVHDRLRSG
jgi:hypothetical protein